MKQLGLALGIASILLAGNAVAKEYFKWTDDQGITHFSANPPKDRPSEAVSTYAGSSTVYNPAAATANTEEAKAEQSQLEKTKEEEQKAAAMKEEKCKRVIEQHKVLTERGRVKMVDKEGKERFLTPEEQKQKTDELQKFMDANCSGKIADKK